MIYTIRKANMITDELKRFSTTYAHRVAGQYANIDFWLDEVITALKTLDEYKDRFNNLKTARADWLEKHNSEVHEYCRICNGRCEFSTGQPSPPTRTSSNTINSTRKELVNAAYYFLTRCYRLALLTEKELKEKCDLIGTSIDPDDLIYSNH